MKSAHVLVWFRRNLRLHDNAALNAAVASGLPIACVWVSQRPSETTIRVKACSTIKPRKSCIPVSRRTIFLYMSLPPTKTSSPWLLRLMPIPLSQMKPTPKPKSAKTTTSGTISTEQALPCNTPTTAAFWPNPPSWMPKACPTPILSPINRHGCRLIQDKGRLKPNCLFKPNKTFHCFQPIPAQYCLPISRAAKPQP